MTATASDCDRAPARRSCRADSRSCARCSLQRALALTLAGSGAAAAPGRRRQRRRSVRVHRADAAARRAVRDVLAVPTAIPQYLQGWRSAYAGDYAQAMPLLESIVGGANDVTLRFRASATVANVQAVATHYDEAFAQLGRLLTLLPQVTDKDARQQGLLVIGYLYNQVGEYDLGLSYADRIAAEDKSAARGLPQHQLRLEALYRSGRLQGDWRRSSTPSRPASRSARCSGRTRSASTSRASTSTRAAKRSDQAADQHYDETRATRYRRLISEYDSLLARAYKNRATPLRHASSPCARSATSPHPEPVHRADGQLVSPAVPARAGAGRHQRCPRLSREIRGGRQRLSRRRQRAADRVRAREARSGREPSADRRAQQAERSSAAAAAARQESGRDQPSVHRAADGHGGVHRAVRLSHQALAAAFHEAVARRRPDRHRQPAVLHRAGGARARSQPQARAGSVRDPVRPGSLQVDQRQVRPRDGRPRPATGRGRVPQPPARQRPVRPLRRRGILHPAAGLQPRGCPPALRGAARCDRDDHDRRRQRGLDRLGKLRRRRDLVIGLRVAPAAGARGRCAVSGEIRRAQLRRPLRHDARSREERRC